MPEITFWGVMVAGGYFIMRQITERTTCLRFPRHLFTMVEIFMAYFGVLQSYSLSYFPSGSAMKIVKLKVK